MTAFSPSQPTWPDSFSPDTLDRHLHPIKTVRRTMECLRAMFPEVPLNGRYWTLQAHPSRREQAQLVLWCDEEVANTLNYEAEATLALIKVPDGKRAISIERMALRTAHWSDLQGWLFHAKTVYDNTLRPPLHFRVETDFTIRDTLRGEVIEYRTGVEVEMPLSLRAIRPRHEGGAKRPLDLHDGSWHLIDDGVVIIPWHLRKLKRHFIHRYTVQERYGFFNTRTGHPVRFPVGSTVEARSDGAAIRRVNGLTRLSADLDDALWAHLPLGTESGTLAHAVRTGVLSREGG